MHIIHDPSKVIDKAVGVFCISFVYFNSHVNISIHELTFFHSSLSLLHSSHCSLSLLFLLADFESGTKIITCPGQYKLCENIVFNPNAPLPGQTPSEDAFDPIFPGEYDEHAYGLGFFAAIAIASSNVELYLNGFTIEQSEGHALFQRFFSLIELADSPFIKNAGPAQFVGDDDYFQAASNVVIVGPGVLGRSSHHGEYHIIYIKVFDDE